MRVTHKTPITAHTPNTEKIVDYVIAMLCKTSLGERDSFVSVTFDNILTNNIHVVAVSSKRWKSSYGRDFSQFSLKNSIGLMKTIKKLCLCVAIQLINVFV